MQSIKTNTHKKNGWYDFLRGAEPTFIATKARRLQETPGTIYQEPKLAAREKLALS